MKQTMNSINKLFEENYTLFLLPSKDHIEYTETTEDEVKFPSIAVYDIKTYPRDHTINSKTEKNMTMIQIDIYTQGKYMTQARAIRDAVTKFLDNKTFDRKDYTNPDLPVKDGEMTFKRVDEQPFHLDNRIKVISLTYEITWKKDRMEE